MLFPLSSVQRVISSPQIARTRMQVVEPEKPDAALVDEPGIGFADLVFIANGPTASTAGR
jgi:hypothetical protein